MSSVCWRVQNISCRFKEQVRIRHAYEKCGLTENIDTTSAGGKLIFHIFGALAEFEHSLTRERTMAGLAVDLVRGLKRGRKPIMSTRDIKKSIGHATLSLDDKERSRCSLQCIEGSIERFLLI